jgi:hypothetical protein
MLDRRRPIAYLARRTNQKHKAMVAAPHATHPENPPSWPWRVLIAVPPDGLGAQFATMRAWLDQNCGPAEWDLAPAGTGGVVNDAVAFISPMAPRPAPLSTASAAAIA